MITKDDLQAAIAECEGVRNPTSSTCMKLAAFYTIKDKMYPENNDDDPVMSYSMASGPTMPETVAYYSDSEFGQLVSGKDMSDIFPLIDELMSTVQVISPRLYAGMIRKLSEI